MQVMRRRLISSAALAWTVKPVRAIETLRLTTVEKWAVSWVSSRLLTEIYKQAGLALQIDPMPVQRAGLMAQTGQADGEVMRVQPYGIPFPQLLRVDPPYYRISVAAYSMPARNARVTTANDLQHYSLGAIRGMTYAQILTENHPAVTQTQNSEQMFRMLQAGRVDLVLETSVAARASMDKLGLKDAVASPELLRLDLFHYLHMRRKDLAPQISETIKRMKASGELDRLISRTEAAITSADIDRFVISTAAPAPQPSR